MADIAVGAFVFVTAVVGALVFVAVVVRALVVIAAFFEALVLALTETLVRDVDISSSTLTALTI